MRWFQALLPREDGFFDQFEAHAITLFTATYMGVPVSTTHTITGAIVGVGAARRTSAVRWGVARSIVVAWIITMPVAGLIAAGLYVISGPVLP
jgi:PiT family inorganic phosphate transporter